MYSYHSFETPASALAAATEAAEDEGIEVAADERTADRSPEAHLPWHPQLEIDTQPDIPEAHLPWHPQLEIDLQPDMPPIPQQEPIVFPPETTLVNTDTGRLEREEQQRPLPEQDQQEIQPPLPPQQQPQQSPQPPPSPPLLPSPPPQEQLQPPSPEQQLEQQEEHQQRQQELQQQPLQLQLELPVGTSVDNLTHELSKQHLRLDELASAHGLPVDSSLRKLTAPQAPSDFEIDDAPTPAPHLNDFTPSLHLDPSMTPSHADEVMTEAAPVMDMPVHQPPRLSHDNPSSTTMMQSLAEDMVWTGTQCNADPTPLPASASTPLVSPRPSTLTLQEFAAKFAASSDSDKSDPFATKLEVDEEYCKSNDGDELTWAEHYLFRRAKYRGLVKRHPSGMLQYQAAADSAFRCANVVKSRPRMRKRDKDRKRAMSVASSIAFSSAAPSPMMHPAPSSMLPLLPPNQLSLP